MINKFEAIGIFVCVGLMACALFLLRLDDNTDLLSSISNENQVASVVTISEGVDSKAVLEESLRDSMDIHGTLKKMIIDDVVLGEGAEVTIGDTVTVHYIGTLQNGQQFDNSYTKGNPFSFTVGEGRVIQGWEQGLIGMKAGGQRILVIPPQLAYGANVVGPIPANSTLVFSIELVEIK